VLPPGVWILIGVAVLAALALRYTRLGRHVFAIGSNEETARLCGIDVERTKLAVYVLAVACAGVAAVLQFAYLSMGEPDDRAGLRAEGDRRGRDRRRELVRRPGQHRRHLDRRADHDRRRQTAAPSSASTTGSRNSSPAASSSPRSRSTACGSAEAGDAMTLLEVCVDSMAALERRAGGRRAAHRTLLAARRRVARARRRTCSSSRARTRSCRCT